MHQRFGAYLTHGTTLLAKGSWRQSQKCAQVVTDVCMAVNVITEEGWYRSVATLLKVQALCIDWRTNAGLGQPCEVLFVRSHQIPGQ